MTRLATCGWETGDISEPPWIFGAGFTHTVVSSSPTPRTPGSYCWKISHNGGGNSYRTFTPASTINELWIRFAYIMTGALNGEVGLFVLRSPDASYHASLTWNPNDNFLRVYRGYPGTGLIATSTQTLPFNEWHTIEMRWKAGTAVNATDGIIEVWVDDARWINLTAIDSQGGSSVGCGSIWLGLLNAGSANWALAYDDLAINDTAGSINNGQIFDGRIVMLRPTGAGSNTDLSRGGTDSGANWSQVEEAPPSMSDYVYGSTPGLRDTYALQNTPAGSYSVNCVESIVQALKSDTGTAAIAPTIKSGATTSEGTTQSTTLNAAYYTHRYETDPDTSAAWTISAVDALEAGVTIK